MTKDPNCDRSDEQFKRQGEMLGEVNDSFKKVTRR